MRLGSGARALVALAAPALLLAAVARCGTDAVGVDACRDIETARCEAAAACGYSETDVERCREFYQDQCLHGVENAAHTPTEQEVRDCVAAVKAVQGCAGRGAASMVECPEVPIIATDPDTGAPVDPAKVTPCGAITNVVHYLAACAFVAAPKVDAGASSDDAAADGALPDAESPSDGGLPDAETPDAPDTKAPDAGEPDAEAPGDASDGNDDAGEPLSDAGVDDAAADEDAGDAAADEDAGG